MIDEKNPYKIKVRHRVWECIEKPYNTPKLGLVSIY